MEFDRALTVAVKIFLVTFFLYLLVDIFLFPLILSEDFVMRTFRIVSGSMLGLFGLAVLVYFILQEAEKIPRKTESYRDTRRYDKQLKDLQEMIDEIDKILPKETSARIEDIKTQCPQCGKKVPKGFKLCPNCGFARDKRAQVSLEETKLC